ncbi:hypothetical protein WDW89_12365 [Deltaproteobacteria bacterium TL4]
MWERYKALLQDNAVRVSWKIYDQVSHQEPLQKWIETAEKQVLAKERHEHEKTKKTLEAARQRMSELESDNQNLQKEILKKDEILKQIQSLKVLIQEQNARKTKKGTGSEILS